jgi:predicted restriction endonuclease
LLDAAHIRSVKEHGSDDPRNGLVLCATHHRAFDAGFFAVSPDYELDYLDDGPTAQELRVTRETIAHLDRKPHKAALEWRWTSWPKGAAAAAGTPT